MTYHARLPSDKKAEVERALEFHPEGCPAYVTVKDAIRFKIDGDFTWE